MNTFAKPDSARRAAAPPLAPDMKLKLKYIKNPTVEYSRQTAKGSPKNLVTQKCIEIPKIFFYFIL